MNHIIPVSIVDNFFEDPDTVRNWALKQDYEPDDRGFWPGLRTKPLYEINPGLNDFINQRYFNLFFDLIRDNIQWVVDSRFQLITGNYGEGWIHQDSDARLTNLVYLTPDPSPNSGTSFYQRKNPNNYHKRKQQLETKVKNYKNQITASEADSVRIELNGEFEETIRVNNVYNRLVTFDSYLPHGAHEFFGGEKDEARLTLIMFVQSLYADRTPISRMKIIM